MKSENIIIEDIKIYCPICGDVADFDKEAMTCDRCGKYYYIRDVVRKQSEDSLVLI